jgi:chemotaxis protein CheD
MLDPKTHSVGMAHIALPDSQVAPAKALERPGHFADTGVPALIREMEKLGCPPKGKGMYVKLVGGANVMDPNNTFNIGKRNVLAIKKLLWQYGMGALAEDVGGSISRTVTVEVDTGKVTIYSSGKGTWEI